MFRIALVSRWHVHSHKPDERYVKEFLSIPDCAVTCVWDKDPAVAETWAAEFGVTAERDLETLLSREDVDGILVTSAAADHREIFIAAAKHKKHIFTEKVLALALEDAYAIRDAIKASGVKFCISFMRLGIRQLAYAKTLVEDGVLGTPVQFRCLCGHRGGLNGDLPEYWYDPEITGGGDMAELHRNGEKIREIPLDEIPAGPDTPVRTWVKACTEGGSDALYGIDAAVDMVRFMAAAYRSHADGGRRTLI